MFNVHVHEFKVGDAVLDAAALEQFQRQWATYGKVVASNGLAHREVGRLLHEALNETFARPFDFLDIACGDASMMKTALAGTRIRHYHGIDLSKPALDLAEGNLDGMPFEVDLDHRDFVDAMLRRPEPADAAWCSLSIHHLSTDDKRRLLQAIRGAVAERGIFLLYEPTLRPNENRQGYFDRFARTKAWWTVLTPPEWEQVHQHVVTCDFPETPAVWCELGRAAGFGEAREVFVDPLELYRLFRYAA